MHLAFAVDLTIVYVVLTTSLFPLNTFKLSFDVRVGVFVKEVVVIRAYTDAINFSENEVEIVFHVDQLFFQLLALYQVFLLL
jgi:hypothetical protein